MLGKNKNIIVLFHVLVWIVLFSFPYLLSSGQQQVLIRVIAHSWVPMTMYAIIFYVNYLFLIDKTLFQKQKTFWFVVPNVALIALAIWGRDQINANFFQAVMPKMDANGGPPFSLILYVQIISFIIPILFSVALKIAERYMKTEAQRKEAEKVKLESELQHLKYQLQPHFFFNSLNNIYSLVDISPDQAKSTIHSLSKLMRYLLYDTTTEKVSLKDEIQFMEKYIELMQLRLSGKTTVDFTFPTVSPDVKVAPLLFISLIENAFKHGVSANAQSQISFTMQVAQNTIVFETQNNNFPKTVSDQSGSGIGLQNLEKRLQLIYPNRHTLHYGVAGEFFKSTLSIQI